MHLGSVSCCVVLLLVGGCAGPGARPTSTEGGYSGAGIGFADFAPTWTSDTGFGTSDGPKDDAGTWTGDAGHAADGDGFQRDTTTMGADTGAGSDAGTASDASAVSDVGDVGGDGPCAAAQTGSCTTPLPGICAAGESTCTDDGTWGPCEPTIAAGQVAENCVNTLDDDCDGKADGEDSNCHSPPLPSPVLGLTGAHDLVWYEVWKKGGAVTVALSRARGFRVAGEWLTGWGKPDFAVLANVSDQQ